MRSIAYSPHRPQNAYFSALAGRSTRFKHYKAMSRRVTLLIALIALALVGAAAAPWTLRENGLSAALSDHMKKRYGLDLTVNGRSTFAVLPIPRVKFEDVTLHFPDQALKAEGGTLRGEIRILPL